MQTISEAINHTLAVMLVAVIGCPIILLEKIGLIKLEQSYTPIGVYDEATGALIKPAE